ncbi:Leucine-rich repeat receptor-like tyrosine-protein kinase PXC3 [Dichanthelium oligosanthes]|uniref:Leucine-rich repeat receptor-like tyrosine-protein kinase PXC3 n=1 Tax=Dichanthelium oligosanthes TaxID=888268 RepID=A0A1E5VZP9_9POAL|nr:Leucine-rich repeat receptor-like tyrosine-protein kinase PXC3 [Dichanthelium oligosanthes]
MPPSSSTRRGFLLFLALLSACLAAPGADGAGVGDGAAMQALRRELAPPGWGPGADHCAWRGVTCDGGAVTAIELPRRGLRGDFSAAAALPALARLDLSANSLRGGVPPALGKLARLEFLDLSMNALSGAVPAGLAGASGLRFLNLSNNALSGAIPDELRGLRELQELQISGNNLTGALPGWLAGLPGLRVLSAYENLLSGPIPPGLGLSSELQVLNLHSNALEGAIPSSLFELGNLQVLILTLNRLNGTIPDAIGRCRGLSNVRIGDNLLSGVIPASIGDATSLTYFEANTNDLSGAIPTQFARCANLTLLNLAYNRLAGEVPDVLGELKNLQELIVSGNGLGGEFPKAILRCRNLSKLDLSYNSFNGDLPENICNGSRMQFLLLDHNEFSGGIPPGIGGCTRLLALQLGSNNLGGEIPAEIGKVKSLQIALNLSSNHFVGTLPRELGRLDKLVTLDLSSNEISGQIPGDMRGMLSLIEVNLSNNRLSGAIPTFGPFQKSAASSFSGNAKLCGDPLDVDCGSIYGSNYGMDHRKISYRVALAVVGSCLLIFSLVSLVVALFMWRERQEKEAEAKKAEAGEVVVAAAPQVVASTVFIESLQQAIDFQSCVKATYKDANELSNGTFSTTYKAVMPSGLVLCVKKLKSVDRAVVNHQTKMIRELERLAHINHKNLVRPIGYVIYDDCALLLHHYMPNGTLLQLLHNDCNTDGEKQKPDWLRLLSIAIDVAEGLAFLHQIATIHLDISSGNIFLDSHYNALLGEVEISKVLDPSKGTASISAVAGSFGYIPPEYAYTMQVTVPGNVYSYGVVLLEILTSKLPVEEEFGEGVDLVKWVHTAPERGETPEQIMDPRLSTVSFAWRRQMLAVLKVAMLCTERAPAKRPRMKKVVEMLQEAKNS